MLDSRRGRFVAIALGMLVVALALSTLFAPPDPATQLIVAAGVMLFVLPVANLLSHPTVYEWLRDR